MMKNLTRIHCRIPTRKTPHYPHKPDEQFWKLKSSLNNVSKHSLALSANTLLFRVFPRLFQHYWAVFSVNFLMVGCVCEDSGSLLRVLLCVPCTHRTQYLHRVNSHRISYLLTFAMIQIH
jgi:hypothetical protein